MIDEIIIKKFIEVGKELEDDLSRAIPIFHKLKNNSDVNTIGPTKCHIIANDLTNTDLCYLIKSIVIAESLFKWVGGSASSSIWLFRELQSKDYSISINLANWILPRTNNYYVPFGFNNHGAKTYYEYLEISKKRSEQFSRSIEFKNKQEDIASKEREKRKQQQKLSAELRKTNERKNFVDMLKNHSVTEQIKILAMDDKYSIGFYPTSVATKSTDEILKHLNQEIILKLLVKLKGKHKGPWGSFKRRLIEI